MKPYFEAVDEFESFTNDYLNTLLEELDELMATESLEDDYDHAFECRGNSFNNVYRKTAEVLAVAYEVPLETVFRDMLTAQLERTKRGEGVAASHCESHKRLLETMRKAKERNC